MITSTTKKKRKEKIESTFSFGFLNNDFDASALSFNLLEFVLNQLLSVGIISCFHIFPPMFVIRCRHIQRYEDIQRRIQRLRGWTDRSIKLCFVTPDKYMPFDYDPSI